MNVPLPKLQIFSGLPKLDRSSQTVEKLHSFFNVANTFHKSLAQIIKDQYKLNATNRVLCLHKKPFDSFFLLTLYLWSLSFKGEKYKNQSQNPQVTAVMIVFRTKIGFIHAQFRCFPGNKQKQARSATNCFLVFFFEGSFINYVDQISTNFDYLPPLIGKLWTFYIYVLQVVLFQKHFFLLCT